MLKAMTITVVNSYLFLVCFVFLFVCFSVFSLQLCVYWENINTQKIFPHK